MPLQTTSTSSAADRVFSEGGRLGIGNLIRGGSKCLGLYRSLIEKHRGFIPAGVVAVRIHVESGGYPRARGKDPYLEEIGLLMVAKATREAQGGGSIEEWFDPEKNIRGGCAHWQSEIRTMCKAVPQLGEPEGAGPDFWKMASMYTAIGAGGTRTLIRRSQKALGNSNPQKIYTVVASWVEWMYSSGRLTVEWEQASTPEGNPRQGWIGGTIRYKDGQRYSVKPETFRRRVLAMSQMTDAAYAIEKTGGAVPYPDADTLWRMGIRDPDSLKKALADPLAMANLAVAGAASWGTSENAGQDRVLAAQIARSKAARRSLQLQQQGRKHYDQGAARSLASKDNRKALDKSASARAAVQLASANVKGVSGAVMYNEFTGRWEDGKV